MKKPRKIKDNIVTNKLETAKEFDLADAQKEHQKQYDSLK